jgi:hypothetical protein
VAFWATNVLIKRHRCAASCAVAARAAFEPVAGACVDKDLMGIASVISNIGEPTVVSDGSPNYLLPTVGNQVPLTNSASGNPPLRFSDDK